MRMVNFNGSVAHLEAKGLSNVWKAYASECASDKIMEIGFNPNSGYVYIALENGITIASCMGQSVEFIVSDFYAGDEKFYDSYFDAINHL
jgi:hypothetical protein